MEADRVRRADGSGYEESDFQGSGDGDYYADEGNGEINYPVFKKLLDRQADGGADAVVVAGTTGENATLDDDEHLELVEFAVKEIAGRIPVIAGAGSNNTAHAVWMSQECEKIGVDGLLHVTPYYNKTSQEGLDRHFRACAQATGLPVILYNVPSRTGVNILPETYQRLSEIDSIVGCKEASGNFSQIAGIAALCGENLTIYTGNDDQITTALALGAQGVISVVGNLLPRETHDICQAYFDGNCEESKRLQLKYLELMQALFMDVNPIPVKQAMRAMGYDVGECRLPLCDMDSVKTERLLQVLRDYGLVEKSVKE